MKYDILVAISTSDRASQLFLKGLSEFRIHIFINYEETVSSFLVNPHSTKMQKIRDDVR